MVCPFALPTSCFTHRSWCSGGLVPFWHFSIEEVCSYISKGFHNLARFFCSSSTRKPHASHSFLLSLTSLSFPSALFASTRSEQMEGICHSYCQLCQEPIHSKRVVNRGLMCLRWAAVKRFADIFHSINGWAVTILTQATLKDSTIKRVCETLTCL